jgi:hypothetical protein
VTAMRAVVAVCAVAALGLSFCHPADRPPVTPSKPTDPTSLARRDPAGEVIDASIVTEGGGWDGEGFELDGGLGRTPSSP